MIVLLWYIFTFFLLVYYKKFSKVDSFIISFFLYYPLVYTVLLVFNFFAISSFLYAVVASLVFIFVLLYLNLIKNLNLKWDSKLFFIILVFVFLWLIWFFWWDYVYDDRSYHIDMVWNTFLNQNVIDGFLHQRAIAYPKFADFINAIFSFPFRNLNIFSFYLWNIFVAIVLVILVYNFALLLWIKKNKNAIFLALLVSFSPIILYQSLSWLVDMTFFVFLLFPLYLLFKPISLSNFLLFIFSIIGLINIKYSWPFLWGFLTLVYLLYNYKFFVKNKIYLLSLLLFIPWFTFYIHHYLVYWTPLYPFVTYWDLKHFFLTLPHAPKGINGIFYKEIFFANIEKPLYWVFANISHFDLDALVTNIVYNNYGLFWILAFFSIFYWTYLSYKDKNYKILVFIGIILSLYFLQSVKWENRYFIHFMLLWYFLLVYIIEKKEKIAKLIYLLFTLQILMSVFSIIYHKLTIYPYYPDKTYEKVEFYKKSEFTYLYFYYLFNKWKKLNIVDWQIDNCTKRLIIYTPNRRPIDGKINCKFKYIDNLGYFIY